MKQKILGLACSLRNARWGAGNDRLINDLLKLSSKDDLKTYLSDQAQMHLDSFIEAGRAKGLDFSTIYSNLKSLRGDRGLSNSEVALAAGLWAASKEGCEIEHLSLSEFFPATGVIRHPEKLRAALMQADGLIVSGPVYFGDRGSLAQQLIEFIRNDAELLNALQQTVYGGISVGAKRNGGQETTLIYQLHDMINLGLLGVGNDSDTTAQYGGTGHAGDVGTMSADNYGLDTAMGVGRRLAQVTKTVQLGQNVALKEKSRIQFWILQDKDNVAKNYLNSLIDAHHGEAELNVIDFSDTHIARCIACDICPTHVGDDQEYRCIISGGSRDIFEKTHPGFIDIDAIVPVIYSPSNTQGLHSIYQQFIERTRYLRRGDYVFSNVLTTPLVIEELGSHQGMAMRAMTSMIRHNTILTEPMIAYRLKNRILNDDQVSGLISRFISLSNIVASGRLQTYASSSEKYQPIGYILSSEVDKENTTLNNRKKAVSARAERIAKDASRRLAKS